MFQTCVHCCLLFKLYLTTHHSIIGISLMISIIIWHNQVMSYTGQEVVILGCAIPLVVQRFYLFCFHVIFPTKPTLQ